MLDGTNRTPRDAELAELARAQHGVVSLAQLRDLGLSASAVRSRVAAGRLHRVHQGVYAVGHPRLTGHGLWMAAVLACGPRAVLSHRSAAAMHDLRRSDRRRVDVTARQAGRRRTGIDAHRGRLAEQDVTVVDGIPCTTVARTLLDLAEVVDARALERAVDRAEQLRVLDVAAVEGAIAQATGRRGAAALKRAIGDFDPQRARTRSELERRFLRLCDQAGVPRPRVNHVVLVEGEPIEVDFAWPDRRLAIELDGHATHGTRRAFEHDRRRDQRLKRAGWDTLRFTWRQVEHDPAETQATLAAVVNTEATPLPETQATLAAVVNAQTPASLH